MNQERSFEDALHLKENVVPKFCKAITVPFALKEAIEQEMNRLEQNGIIEKVSYSPWAAPIVPVPKGDGCIRLCGDYKVTINSMLEIDKYSPNQMTFLQPWLEVNILLRLT